MIQKAIERKTRTWDEYCKEQIEIFNKTSIFDPINSTIKIGNIIPNWDEFDRMVTILKDEYGENEFGFVCAEYGYDRFYCMYKETGLSDTVKIIQDVNEVFKSELLRKFINLDLTGSIVGSRGENNFCLHMSRRQKATINRTIKNFNGNESQFGLMSCILTFNWAKEKFERLRTDKFKVYYQDNGYAKIIKDEIIEANKVAILRLAETFPILVEGLEEKKSSEMKEDYEYRLSVLKNVYDYLVNNGIFIPNIPNFILNK